MNQIDILIEGYVKVTDTGWEATSNTTLITTDSGVKIIVDPGSNRDLLLKQLETRSFGPEAHQPLPETLEAINFVFLTHHHLDHSLLVGIFPKARIVDVEGLDWQAQTSGSPKMIPNTDITILATPGHTPSHGVLIVSTKDGTVVVAGDNFWWTTEEDQKVDIHKPDDFASDMPALIKSRKEVLDLADFVIPGHGKMFRVNK